MGFSNYWRNKTLSHLFGKEVYSAPTIYVALSLANPLGDGSGMQEPSGGSYARVATIASDWSEVSAFEIQNVNQVTFSEATGSWGTVTYFALFDALSGGNLLAFGALTSSLSVASGDPVYFGAGHLSVTH